MGLQISIDERRGNDLNHFWQVPESIQFVSLLRVERLQVQNIWKSHEELVKSLVAEF